MLNAGLGFSDEFELEACNYSDKTSRKLKKQYTEWLSILKTVKNKANPAMKSAVKSVCFAYTLPICYIYNSFKFVYILIILLSR